MYLPFVRKYETRSSRPLISPYIPEVSLELAGIVALADLTTVSERTALMGASTYLDTFVLCPGLHREHWAPELNQGEYPDAANMMSDNVFRVENPGTVVYLRRVSRTGQLTTLKVSTMKPETWFSVLVPYQNVNLISATAYTLCVALTITVLILMGLAKDWWGIFVVGVLAVCRLLNIIILRFRAAPGWSGEEEKGVEGDVIVLLSQDRWVRIRGLVDDLKAVTSGQWLSDMSPLQGIVVATSTVLMYLDAALASNLQNLGKILLIVLLIGTAGLLEIANSATDKQMMHGRILAIDGPRTPYKRRLHMAKELLRNAPTKNWARQMGMVSEKDWSAIRRELEEEQAQREGDDGPQPQLGALQDNAQDLKGEITKMPPIRMERVTT